MKLALAQIRLDGGTQSRASLDEQAIGTTPDSAAPDWRAEFPNFPDLDPNTEFWMLPQRGGDFVMARVWSENGTGFDCEIHYANTRTRSKWPMPKGVVPYWFVTHGVSPNAGRWEAEGAQRRAEKVEAPEVAAEEHESDPSAKVYLIQQGEDGPIKIGTSMDVPARLRDLQTANPYPLRLLRTLPGSERVERELHKRFARLRLHGEWFKPSPALLAFAAEVQS